MSASTSRTLTSLALMAITLVIILVIAPAAWGQSSDLQRIESKYDYSTLSSEDRQQLAQLDASSASLDKVSDELALARLQSEREQFYVIILAVLSVISLILVLVSVFKTEHSARDLVNAAGLTLVIYGTIILVILVDTHEQLTGGIGILGAIAGYLFGAVQRSTIGHQR